jgi:hypothetical protein
LGRVRDGLAGGRNDPDSRSGGRAAGFSNGRRATSRGVAGAFGSGELGTDGGVDEDGPAAGALRGTRASGLGRTPAAAVGAAGVVGSARAAALRGGALGSGLGVTGTGLGGRARVEGRPGLGGRRRPSHYDAAGQLDRSFYAAPLEADHVPAGLPDASTGGVGHGRIGGVGSVRGGDFDDRAVARRAAARHEALGRAAAERRYGADGAIAGRGAGTRGLVGGAGAVAGGAYIDVGGSAAAGRAWVGANRDGAWPSDDEDLGGGGRTTAGYGRGGGGRVDPAGVYVPRDGAGPLGGSTLAAAGPGTNFQYSYGTPAAPRRRSARLRMQGRDRVLLD